MSLRRQLPGWAAAWCWPTWPWGTGHRAMTRSGWQAHSCTSSRGSETPMALTSLVKDELSRVSVLKPCCRKAEVSTILRFAGGLHLAAGRIVVEAELDTGAAARRLRKDIAEVFGHTSDMIVLAPGGLRQRHPHLVRARADGGQLAPPRPGGGAQGRRQPARADGPVGQPRPSGPRPAQARGVRARLRLRGGLA